MKISFTCCLSFLTLLFVLSSGCKKKVNKADIPDIQAIYSNIQYLDTLIRSGQIDSISNINDHVTAIITAYASRARSPEDKAILDSLDRIRFVAHGFLQFCTGTKTNLDLLEQDTRSLENNYRSGKIKITAYTAALLEAEQVLVDLSIQLADQNLLTLQYLKNQEALVKQLSDLTLQGN